MYALLRQLANEEVRLASIAMNDYILRHGHPDEYLVARYHAADHLLQLIDAELTARQRDDVGAPVYFDLYAESPVTESELRLMDGNR